MCKHVHGRLKLVLFLSVFLLFCGKEGADHQKPGYPMDNGNWEMVWSDEFDGTALDVKNWNYSLGGGGWGNDEWQYYQQQNVSVSDGSLKITVLKESVEGHYYTSGRILTRGKKDWKYGKFEARIKLAKGDGLWPAFWMLPTPGGWPRNGEIDIMENAGCDLTQYDNTLHYGPSSGNYYSDSREIAGQLDNEWNNYAVIWREGEVKFLFNNYIVHTCTSADKPAYGWPFDNNNFYIILNMAIGGTYVSARCGYNPPESLPAVMEVDYVRVYKAVE